MFMMHMVGGLGLAHEASLERDKLFRGRSGGRHEYLDGNAVLRIIQALC